MHALLEQQLERLGLDAHTVPDAARWAELVELVSSSYIDAARELAATRAQLGQARELAELAARAKGELLLNMSHEMRTPLNAILGFARVLERELRPTLGADHRQFLHDIVHAGGHLLQLVNDLLDLRSLEARPLALVDVDLVPLIFHAVPLVSPLVHDKQIDVSMALPERLPRALADRRCVVQILVNLLSNAAKFTAANGSIKISARRQGERVEIAVADSGIGISTADQARLFVYFEQLGGRREGKLKGSGVGLALTRALVEKLGGEIRVESVPRQGSTFRVSLRVAP